MWAGVGGRRWWVACHCLLVCLRSAVSISSVDILTYYFYPYTENFLIFRRKPLVLLCSFRRSFSHVFEEEYLISSIISPSSVMPLLVRPSLEHVKDIKKRPPLPPKPKICYHLNKRTYYFAVSNYCNYK